MEITEKRKYLGVAIFFFIIVVLFMFFKLRPAYIYMVILTFSIFVIYFLRMMPIKGEITKGVLLLCVAFFVNSILLYYYGLVWIDSDKPYVMKAASVPPIIVGLVLAPIVEEIGFRRVFLGALLKANIHWFIASILTAVLFVFAHPPSSWANIVVTSFLLSKIYAISGNLKLVIFLHFFHNAIYHIDPSIWHS